LEKINSKQINRFKIDSKNDFNQREEVDEDEKKLEERGKRKGRNGKRKRSEIL